MGSETPFRSAALAPCGAADNAKQWIRGTKRALLAACLGAIAATGAAAADTWISVGPPGGDVRSLAADPRHRDRVYLGTADGVVYRSQDGGRRWERMSPGFPKRGMSLDEILVDPSGTLLVGYWEVAGKGGGVARSSDGGVHFTLLPGLEGESVRALAAAPGHPRVLVAGALSGVFRSADGGETWSRVSPPGHNDLRNVGSVAIDPANPEVFYAGTWHLPWKTEDGGRTWRPIASGMIADSDVMTLTLDRRSRDLVYATACSGIYRSGEAGARWVKIKGIPSSSRRTRAFAQDPEWDQTFYAGTTEGLWISEDNTATWRLATTSRLVVNAVLARPGGSLLLGTDGAGVLLSLDRGRTWAESNQGFSERFITHLLPDPGGRRLLAAVWGDRLTGGVYVAPSPQGPWSRLGPGLEGREVLVLASAGDDLLAGTDDGLYSFTAPAGSWRRLPMVLGGLDLHPRVTDVVALQESTFLAATPQGLLRSTDRGASWTQPTLGPGVALSVAASAERPGLALAVTALGIYRSDDFGLRWALVSSGLPAEPRTLAFLPGSERIVFAATPVGLFRSHDQGRTWATGTGGLPVSDITGLALAGDGRTLYASDFTWGGVFRSPDAGLTWTRLPGQGLLTERVWAVAIDPPSASVLAASATGGLHLLRSEPGGMPSADSK